MPRLARPFVLVPPFSPLWWERIYRAATSRALATDPVGEETSRWFRIAAFADRRWYVAAHAPSDGE